MNAAQTAVAIATAPAAGGVGIIRLSGPGALRAARQVAPGLPRLLEPRRAYFTPFRDSTGRVLDEGLVLYFEAPHSFTGEEVVELQAHGSPRLLELLLRQLVLAEEVRLAEPGEFTRRAFLNGRMDLARAEAVAELVAAGSEAAVLAAAAGVSGALSSQVRALREPLLKWRAQVEGALEFPEEVPAPDGALVGSLESLRGAARRLLAQGARGRLVRRGARVVLFGPANAGKSTLFNRLLGDERALVDAEPGTTRDVLEARLELQGLGLTLQDTAGLRSGEAAGRLEALGMERTRQALRAADLAVLILPPGAGPEQVEAWKEQAGRVPCLVLSGKSDLGGPVAPGACAISGLTGEGIAALEAALLDRLLGSPVAEAVLVTSERHAQALHRALEALERSLEAVRLEMLEVVSGELGLAIEALGEITGENAPEELVDEIFRHFCLGK